MPGAGSGGGLSGALNLRASCMDLGLTPGQMLAVPTPQFWGLAVRRDPRMEWGPGPEHSWRAGEAG